MDQDEQRLGCEKQFLLDIENFEKELTTEEKTFLESVDKEIRVVTDVLDVEKYPEVEKILLETYPESLKSLYFLIQGYAIYTGLAKERRKFSSCDEFVYVMSLWSIKALTMLQHSDVFKTGELNREGLRGLAVDFLVLDIDYSKNKYYDNLKDFTTRYSEIYGEEISIV